MKANRRTHLANYTKDVGRILVDDGAQSRVLGDVVCLSI